MQIVRGYVSEHLAAYVSETFKEGHEQTLARRYYTHYLCYVYLFWGPSQRSLLTSFHWLMAMASRFSHAIDMDTLMIEYIHLGEL